MPGSIPEQQERLSAADLLEVKLRFPVRSPMRRLHYSVGMEKRTQSKTGERKRARAKIISSRLAYRGPAFWVTIDQVLEPTGVKARRDIVHHDGSVVILAVEKSGGTARVLLERQYRHAANDFLWELPAGRRDPGEKELSAAKRELHEETGYTAASWRRIFRYYASPGFLAETMSIFLATDLHRGKAKPEEDERIRKQMVPLKNAVRMVLSGKIKDAKTILSILWLDHQLRTGQKVA